VSLLSILILMSMSARFHARDHTTIIPTGLVLFYSLLACLVPTQVLTHLFLITGDMGFQEKWLYERQLKTPPKCRCLRYRFPERCRYVWYVMVLACAIGMIAYILSITMMFDQNPYYFCKGQTTLSWLWDFLGSYALAVFVVEPLKILCIVASKYLLGGGATKTPAPTTADDFSMRSQTMDSEMVALDRSENEKPSANSDEIKASPITDSAVSQ